MLSLWIKKLYLSLQASWLILFSHEYVWMEIDGIRYQAKFKEKENESTGDSTGVIGQDKQSDVEV